MGWGFIMGTREESIDALVGQLRRRRWNGVFLLSLFFFLTIFEYLFIYYFFARQPRGINIKKEDWFFFSLFGFCCFFLGGGSGETQNFNNKKLVKPTKIELFNNHQRHHESSGGMGGGVHGPPSHLSPPPSIGSCHHHRWPIPTKNIYIIKNRRKYNESIRLRSRETVGGQGLNLHTRNKIKQNKRESIQSTLCWKQRNCGSEAGGGARTKSSKLWKTKATLHEFFLFFFFFLVSTEGHRKGLMSRTRPALVISWRRRRRRRGRRWSRFSFSLSFFLFFHFIGFGVPGAGHSSLTHASQPT